MGPGEAVKFFRALALGCLLPASQTSYVLSLMENIEPGESWGLGSAGFSSVAFKGGWGPRAAATSSASPASSTRLHQRRRGRDRRVRAVLWRRDGNADPRRWGPDAVRRGYAVNTAPAVGSVAWSDAGTFGHVAYVVAVGGGSVTIEEYNHSYTGTYDKRTVPASTFTGYIHFKDVPPEPVPRPPPAPTPTPTPPQRRRRPPRRRRLRRRNPRPRHLRRATRRHEWPHEYLGELHERGRHAGTVDPV